MKTTPAFPFLLICAAIAFVTPVRSLALTPDGWEYVGTDDGVVVYRKPVDGSDTVAFRGVTYASLPIGKLVAIYSDPAEREHWVDRYVEHVTFEKTVDAETYWIHFGLPWPVSDRDYVLHSEATRDRASRTYTVQIKSVTHPKKAEDDCCIRAIAYRTFFEFTAIPGEERTKIAVEVHTDPKGSLPSWLVNLIQKSWPAETLNGLIRHVAASPRRADAAFAEWHAK